MTRFSMRYGVPQGVRPSPPQGQASRSAQEADPKEPAEERDHEIYDGVGVRVRVDDGRKLGHSDAVPAIEFTDRSGKTIRHQR